jgi:predicted HAD superfamily Cof-like phosphohydrolase
MQEQLSKVAKFHRVFKQKDGVEPQLLSKNDFLLRHKLMAEENEEYLEACEQDDMVEIADALGDQLYILCGTILKHGMQNIIEDVFNEIQESNMSKLDENGEPLFREDGKIMKSKLYFPPNIERILNK